MASGIVHDEARGRFTHVRDGHESYLVYRRLDASTLDFVSTYTPPPIRGRGIAAHVVRHALEWAQAEGFKVVPTCWFVAEYIDRDPRFRSLVASR